jgi:rubredoxin
MKNMECLKCGHEFEGFIGDNCPKCGAENKDVVDKIELENE